MGSEFTAIILVCGLRGAGKTFLCHQLAQTAQFPVEHVEYDKLLDWGLDSWKEKRREIVETVSGKLRGEAEKKRQDHQTKAAGFSSKAFLIDDNFYYESMRNEWKAVATQSKPHGF